MLCTYRAGVSLKGNFTTALHHLSWGRFRAVEHRNTRKSFPLIEFRWGCADILTVVTGIRDCRIVGNAVADRHRSAVRGRHSVAGTLAEFRSGMR